MHRLCHPESRKSQDLLDANKLRVQKPAVWKPALLCHPRLSSNPLANFAKLSIVKLMQADFMMCSTRVRLTLLLWLCLSLPALLAAADTNATAKDLLNQA